MNSLSKLNYVIKTLFNCTVHKSKKMSQLHHNITDIFKKILEIILHFYHYYYFHFTNNGLNFAPIFHASLFLKFQRHTFPNVKRNIHLNKILHEENNPCS